MKVLDLRCENGHVFEGWFASEDEFRVQSDGGMLVCPMCEARGVMRLPSAPRLNLGEPSTGARQPEAPQESAHEPPAAAEVQGAWLRMVRHVMNQTEDVGTAFADEARRIHYGEAPERGIRGQTTTEDAKALKDEGIEVFSLPVPPGLKGSAH